MYIPSRQTKIVPLMLKEVLEKARNGPRLYSGNWASQQLMEIHEVEEFHELRAGIARLNGKVFDPLQQHRLISMTEISL